MHYPEYAFTVNGKKTLESKYGIPLFGIELSPTDVKQARTMYRCPAGDFNVVYCMLSAIVYMHGILNLTCSAYYDCVYDTYILLCKIVLIDNCYRQ